MGDIETYDGLRADVWLYAAALFVFDKAVEPGMGTGTELEVEVEERGLRLVWVGEEGERERTGDVGL